MLIFVFIEVIVFILMILAGLFLIYGIEDKKKVGCTETSGVMQSLDVSYWETNFGYPSKKVSERFDDKYFEHLENIQESRDKTFMKGIVFLREK